LDWVRTFVKSMDMEPAKKDLVVARITALIERIDKEPKGIGWKMRAKIGDKVVWYDLPERVGKIQAGE
jgi:hypothetical protein